MTWGEFKKQVEASGARDDDKIDWIDTSSGYGNMTKVHVSIEEKPHLGGRYLSISESEE